jgi:hypothetical protein
MLKFLNRDFEILYFSNPNPACFQIDLLEASGLPNMVLKSVSKKLVDKSDVRKPA